MPLNEGLESLVQKGKSPFYLELTELYQEIFTALQSVSPLKDADVYTCLKNHGFQKRIKDLVSKHMGITLTQVIVEDRTLAMMHCMFSIPQSVKRASIQTLTEGTILSSINRYYDDKTGKLDSSYLSKLPARFDLGLTTGFWTIKDRESRFYFTAEELAAVTLHELGHVDFLIRQDFRVAVNMVDASEIVNYVTTHPNKESILTLLDCVGKSIYFDKRMLPIVDVLRKFFEQANDITDPSFIEALSTLSFLVASEVSSENFVSLDRFLDDRYAEMKTKNQLLDTERSADEFSSRHGSYSALVSSLYKMRALETYDAKLEYSVHMWSGAASLISCLQNFTALFYLPAENVANGYDPLLRRLSLIVETAKHAFHQEDLPQNVKNDITRQIDEAEAYIKRYQSTANFRIRKEIADWKNSIKRFGRIIAAPFQNRLSQDYGRLQDASRSLSRHGLYYLAKK